MNKFCTNKKCTYRLCKFHQRNLNIYEPYSITNLEGLQGCKKGVKVAPESKEEEKTSKVWKVVCVETGITYDSIKEAGEQTDINIGSIYRVVTGRAKSAGGYTWKWIGEEKSVTED